MRKPFERTKKFDELRARARAIAEEIAREGEGEISDVREWFRTILSRLEGLVDDGEQYVEEKTTPWVLVGATAVVFFAAGAFIF